MKFSKLIKQHAWTDVAPEFVKHYPKREHLLDMYEELYGTWQRLTPAYTDISIDILPARPTTDDYDEFWDGWLPDRYPIIYGCRRHLGDGGHRLSNFQMGFVYWEEWLGMDVMKETRQKFSPVEIICHCMRIMTYHGYAQDAIQCIKAMIKDEAEYHFIDKVLAERPVDTNFLSMPLEPA
jgi:hypothetical protein